MKTYLSIAVVIFFLCLSCDNEREFKPLGHWIQVNENYPCASFNELKIVDKDKVYHRFDLHEWSRLSYNFINDNTIRTGFTTKTGFTTLHYTVKDNHTLVIENKVNKKSLIFIRKEAFDEQYVEAELDLFRFTKMHAIQSMRDTCYDASIKNRLWNYWKENVPTLSED